MGADSSNVPGVAAYFYAVNELRWLVATYRVPGLSLPDGARAARGEDASTLVRLSTAGNLVTGAVARVSIGLLLNPVTIVKARFESSHYSQESYPTMSLALRQIYREGGFRGLFRGFSAAAVRDAPYAGLYLALYEKSKTFYSERFAHGKSSATGDWRVVSLSGFTAGTLATVVTHPFDIIKTRMQTTPSAAHMSVDEKNVTFLRTARHVLHTDGLTAFTDGLGLRCARKALSSMIGWSIFELGTRWTSNRSL